MVTDPDTEIGERGEDQSVVEALPRTAFVAIASKVILSAEEVLFAVPATAAEGKPRALSGRRCRCMTKQGDGSAAPAGPSPSNQASSNSPWVGRSPCANPTRCHARRVCRVEPSAACHAASPQPVAAISPVSSRKVRAGGAAFATY